MNALPFYLQVVLALIAGPAVAGVVLALLFAPRNKE